MSAIACFALAASICLIRTMRSSAEKKRPTGTGASAGLLLAEATNPVAGLYMCGNCRTFRNPFQRQVSSAASRMKSGGILLGRTGRTVAITWPIFPCRSA